MSTDGRSSHNSVDLALVVIQKILNEKRKINNIDQDKDEEQGEWRGSSKKICRDRFINDDIYQLHLPKFDSIPSLLKVIYSTEYMKSEKWSELKMLLDHICVHYHTEYISSLFHHISTCPPDIDDKNYDEIESKFMHSSILPACMRQWIILQNLIVYVWFDDLSLNKLLIQKDKRMAIASSVQEMKSRFINATDAVVNSLNVERISSLHLETAFRLHILKDSIGNTGSNANPSSRIPDLVSFLFQISNRVVNNSSENSLYVLNLNILSFNETDSCRRLKREWFPSDLVSIPLIKNIKQSILDLSKPKSQIKTSLEQNYQRYVSWSKNMGVDWRSVFERVGFDSTNTENPIHVCLHSPQCLKFLIWLLTQLKETRDQVYSFTSCSGFGLSIGFAMSQIAWGLTIFPRSIAINELSEMYDMHWKDFTQDDENYLILNEHFPTDSKQIDPRKIIMSCPNAKILPSNILYPKFRIWIKWVVERISSFKYSDLNVQTLKQYISDILTHVFLQQKHNEISMKEIASSLVESGLSKSALKENRASEIIIKSIYDAVASFYINTLHSAATESLLILLLEEEMDKSKSIWTDFASYDLLFPNNLADSSSKQIVQKMMNQTCKLVLERYHANINILCYVFGAYCYVYSKSQKQYRDMIKANVSQMLGDNSPCKKTILRNNHNWERFMLSIRTAGRESNSSRYDEIQIENDFANLVEESIGISVVNSLERKWKTAIFETNQTKKSGGEIQVDRSNPLSSDQRISSNEKNQNSNEVPTNAKQVPLPTTATNILKPRQKVQSKAIEDDINVMIAAHNQKNPQTKAIDKSNFFAYNMSNGVVLSSQSTDDV